MPVNVYNLTDFFTHFRKYPLATSISTSTEGLINVVVVL